MERSLQSTAVGWEGNHSSFIYNLNNVEIRHTLSQTETQSLESNQLRDNFLIQNLAGTDQLNVVYSHYDRVVIGLASPVNQTLILPSYPNLKADFFLQRREIGIINLGGKGTIMTDSEIFDLEQLACLYIGKGVQNVSFKSQDSTKPALFFMLSTPAHQHYPSCKMNKEAASPVDLGSEETANERTIYKYIHLGGIQSCQLVMGLTILKKGSVWNTMPAHVHDCRMEVYLYFDLPSEHRVFHLMGQPQNTRHLVVANHEAVISPPWSIHSGCGTTNYSFIWGMAGENLDFTDMDFTQIADLK
jgi:4-deoxy-L-threo-5-hexosulose-uronate ketol-isomerase